MCLFTMFTTGPIFRQYIVVATVNLCSLSIGLELGWSSPGLVKLKDANQTTLSRAITEDEGSWIVSFSCLTGIASIFAAPFLMDMIGRKYSIMLAAVLKMTGCVMQTLAPEVWMVLMARALLGGMDAILLCVLPAYASEIASKEIRGALGAILNLFIAFGILVMLCVGPFCSYRTMNILYTVVTLGATAPLMFLPESPYFLYAKGRKEEAKNVLTFLRNCPILVNEEINQYSLANNGGRVNSWLLFKNRIFLKSMAISGVFMIGGQLVGHNVIMSYLQTILELTDTDVKPEIASIVIGCVTVTASTFTFFCSDKFGRKHILGVTLGGAAVGLLGLALFFKMKVDGWNTTGFFNYLPVLSLILFFFCQASGFSSTSTIVISELFDGPARATGVSVMMLASSLVLFISGKYFVKLTSALGYPTVYWLFSMNSLLTCLFVVFFLPETKGKTFAEIQELLGAKKCSENKECADI